MKPHVHGRSRVFVDVNNIPSHLCASPLCFFIDNICQVGGAEHIKAVRLAFRSRGFSFATLDRALPTEQAWTRSFSKVSGPPVIVALSDAASVWENNFNDHDMTDKNFWKRIIDGYIWAVISISSNLVTIYLTLKMRTLGLRYIQAWCILWLY